MRKSCEMKNRDNQQEYCWLSRVLNRVMVLAVGVVLFSVPVHATIDFSSFASRITIEPTSSSLILSKANQVNGWGEFSIVKSQGFDTSDNWQEQYYDNVIISQEGSEIPATDLVTSNSNAIVGLKAEFGDNVTIYDTHQIYAGTGGNNSNTSEENLVYFKDGFTILGIPDLTLNTPIPATGKIDLNNNAITLANDFYLGSNAYLTNGGSIDGQGYSLVLSCSLVIPASQQLIFTGDTIVNGHGTTLFLESGASLVVSDNVTVTLKNIRIKNTSNSEFNPMISFGTSPGWLALQDVELDLADDFYLGSNGRLFIHGDVVVAGNSSFIYESSQPASITDGATWGFDPGTTFYYKPPVADTGLIRMYGEKSAMYFDGASLHTTYTGLRLSKGSLYLDNKVTVSTGIYIAPPPTPASWDIVEKASVGHPFGSNPVGDSSWDPNHSWLAVSGEFSDQFAVYGFDGTDFTFPQPLTGSTVTFPYAPVMALDWSPVPDGPSSYLAVVGSGINVYGFDGSSFADVATVTPMGSGLYYAVAWDPTGQYLAVSYFEGPSNAYVAIYEFDGSSLSFVTQLDLGGGSMPVDDPVYALAWEPSGTYPPGIHLLIGAGDSVWIRQFDGTNLNGMDFVSTPMSVIRTIAFSPSGAYVAVGGEGFPLFQIYDYMPGSLNPNTDGGFGSDVYSIAWNVTSDALFVGGQGSMMAAYSCNGSSVTQLDTHNWSGSDVKSIESLPAWDYFSVVGQPGALYVYDIQYTPALPSPPAPPLSLSNGLIFGDSSLPDGDLSVHVLGGAHVEITGVVADDSL